MRWSLSSSAWRRPERWASASSATHSVAVRNATSVADHASAGPERDPEVGLAGAGRPEQHDVLAAVKEVELAEVQHRVAADRGLKGEVEVLERLARGEPRGLDPRLAAMTVAAVDLGLQQHLGEALERPLLGAGAVGELGQRPRRRRRLGRPE
jgi:hypothetical protein